MDNLCVLILLVVCSYTMAVKINEVLVPEEIQHGTRDSIILDCKYQLQDDSDINDLVIKWYFRQEHLIYQWIAGKKPQAVGAFKDKIDLSYSVSNNPHMKHRALRITKVTPDLTGAYTCSVSCFNNEVSLTKEMVIYEPPQNFTFVEVRNNSELLCSVYDISPEPVISVYASGINLTQVVEDNEEEYDEKNDINTDVPDESSHGLYNITKSFKYDSVDITDSTLFFCELTIPKTKFRQILNLTFYSGSAKLIRSSGTVIILSLTTILFLHL